MTQNKRTIAVLFLAAITACAQTSPSGSATHAQLPDWDVVSVKPASPQSCARDAGMRTADDGLSAFCVPLSFVMETAYQWMETSRIIGMPEWAISGQLWNIDAKVAAADVPAFASLSRDDQFRMLRSILAERFHLKVHTEQRAMPLYQLVIAKGGPKLKQATPDDINKSHILGGNAGRIVGVGALLDSLPSLLSSEVGRPVVDHTGLTGRYDFTLVYVPVARAATDQSGGPSLFTALQEQMGLRMTSARGPMDVLVIDSVQPARAD